MLLRDYQLEMVSRLERAWTRHRSVLVQMPTGTGKTVLMAEVISKWVNHTPTLPGVGARVLIVAHRRELIEQIKRTVRAFGMTQDNVVVESIQKLSVGGGDPVPSSGHPAPSFGLVIIDEAHHALAKTYRALWDRWPEARFLGLTATPCRMNRAGFLDLFETLIQSYPIQEFIRMGWLSDFEYVTAEPDNPILRQVAGLTKRGLDGDYQTKEMALVMDCEESVRHLYQTYRKFVDGKKGIVYAINREHARHIQEYYQRMGVNCCWIEARTPAKERDRLVQDYRDGLMDVVVNVDILGEGVDFPEVEFIQLARPTLSLSRYLQQVGRGMRISKGKDCVTILDHVGMYQAYGLPTENWNWQLMFTGRLAGKAGIGRQGLLYVREGANDRELLNLQMVRIKRMNEEHRGLEVFIQNGLYGIAKDGNIIHKPLFEHVTLTSDGFFARCTYPYPVYKNRTTLIDQKGRDMRLRMYGRLEWVGDVLKGRDINDRPLFWDRKYDKYYDEMPEFTAVADVEMTKLKNGYTLRKYPQLIKPIRSIDIYYNSKMIWMGDWVLLKWDEDGRVNYSPRRIVSYGDSYFYVQSERVDEPSITVIDTEGAFVRHCWMVPENDDFKRPHWYQIPLRNALTGKIGFPDG